MGKHNGRGQGSYTEIKKGLWMGRKQVDGHRYTVYGKSKKEAVQKLDELLSKVRRGEYINDKTITLEEWAQKWEYDYLPSGRKEETQIKYQRNIRLYILPELGKLKLCELKPAHIQRAFTHMSESGRSYKTLQNVKATLHSICEAAVDNEYIFKNPCKNIRIQNTKPFEAHPMSIKEMELFYRTAEDDRYKDYYLIASLTGMRRGEIMGLTWDCINFDENIICVKKQLQYIKSRKGYVFTTPKSQRANRIMAVSPCVMDIFRRIKNQQDEWKNKVGDAWQDKHGLVFTHEDGKHYSASTIDHHHKKIAVKMGVSDIRLHDHRHSLTTYTYENGGDQYAMQEQLGHSSLNMTGHYTHATNEGRERNINIVSELVKKLDIT